jgi:hypothetical protein
MEKIMKYQVVLNNKVLSTHKNHDLAEKALKRWGKKHKAQGKGRVIGEFLVGGIYHIEAV